MERGSGLDSPFGPPAPDAVRSQSIKTGKFQQLSKPTHDDECDDGFQVMGYIQGNKVFRLLSP